MSDFEKILAKYDALTQSLDFSKIIKENGGNFAELETIEGHSYCRGLFKSKQIGIMSCYHAENSVLKNHKHKTKELLIVFEGSLTLSIKNEPDKLLKEGDMYYINANVEHLIRNDEQCRYISVTIPSDKAYVS